MSGNVYTGTDGGHTVDDHGDDGGDTKSGTQGETAFQSIPEVQQQDHFNQAEDTFRTDRHKQNLKSGVDGIHIIVRQIIDIILLIVIFATAVRSFINGFFAAVVDLIGNIVGLIASWILANRWAPVIFEKFFRDYSERTLGRV